MSLVTNLLAKEFDMLVTHEKGSTWIFNNGKFKDKVRIIRASKSKVVFKSDFNWYNDRCSLDHFLNNAEFLRERKRHHNQVNNLPKYFKLEDLLAK